MSKSGGGDAPRIVVANVNPRLVDHAGFRPRPELAVDQKHMALSLVEMERSVGAEDPCPQDDNVVCRVDGHHPAPCSNG